MKEQGKTHTHTQKINNEKIVNLPEKEFRVMIVKMIQDLRKKECRHILRRQKKCLTKN